jgi:Mce-associated membrane protein
VNPRHQLRLAVVTTVSVLAVFAAGLSALAAERVSHRHALDRARENGIAAATTGVATVLSYDYRHLAGDFKKAEGLLTASFRKKYDKTTAAAVEPLAAKYKAQSSAQVNAAGTVSIGVSRVVVLVFVDQTVTNSQLSAPRLDRSRINVTMVHQGDRWLIDGMSPI